MNKLEEFFNNMTLKKLAALGAGALGFALLVSVIMNWFSIYDFFHVIAEKNAVCAEIVSIINERDEEKLTGLFSAALNEHDDVNVRAGVKDFFALLDGKIISYEFRGKRDSALFDPKKGTYSFEKYIIFLSEVKTGSGNTYRIEFNYTTDGTEKGISLLKLYKCAENGSFSEVVNVGKNINTGYENGAYDYDFSYARL